MSPDLVLRYRHDLATAQPHYLSHHGVEELADLGVVRLGVAPALRHEAGAVLDWTIMRDLPPIARKLYGLLENDRFEAGGLSYSVVDPLKSVSMTFSGDLVIVEDPDALRDPGTLFQSGPRLPGHVHWVHEAESPVHGGEPVDDSVQTMYGRDFSYGHFNQHGRARGRRFRSWAGSRARTSCGLENGRTGDGKRTWRA